MANSLPWSVKGVDPRTRDAAKAAARRAGMTLGEWLDHKIRDESEEADFPAAAPAPAAPEQLDIAALSERLARLSQGRTDTAARQAAPSPSREAIDSLVGQAAALESMTREANARTAGALDSITRWIEKTEDRLSSSERGAAERQERATNVIADAIKTMGERIAEIERRGAEAQQTRTEQAPRLAFSREGLAAAVTDIRTRQRVLDTDEAVTQRPAAVAPERISALREDLREIGSRLSHEGRRPAQPQRPAAPVRVDTSAIEAKIGLLADRLDRLDRRDQFEPLLKPLTRIEAEVSRLSQDRAGESYQRFQLEIAHLAAKVDALATRGGQVTNLDPVRRDIAELRDLLGASGQDHKLENLSEQVATLGFEIGRLRDVEPDMSELRSLASAIDDVRSAVLSQRGQIPGAHLLTGLGAQIDALSRKFDEVATQKLDETASQQQSDYLVSRIDSLQQRIETLAEQGPSAVTRQIEALSGRIESLAASSQLTRMVGEGAAAVDLNPIEQMLKHLADKIDEAGAPGANAESFDALERQISGIASRLDEASATRSAENGMERTLQDLVVHLRSMREETAAERAALVQAASTAAPGKGIAELSSLVTGLRDTHVSSDRQTRDALGAVHDSLETIMSRLASLEAELQGEHRPTGNGLAAAMRAGDGVVRANPAPARNNPGLSVGVAAQDRFANPAAELPSSEPVLPTSTAFDIPLEPGSGRPRPEAAAGNAQDPQSVRQSLIAAARRSAKAASEAAASTPSPAAEPAAKSPSRLKEILEKRKRPLLLGLAALILAMGTAHLVTNSLRGDSDKAANSEARSLIAPPAALPEAPAAPAQAPAKDQSSALPAATQDVPVPSTASNAASERSVTAPAVPPVAETASAATAAPAESIQPVTGIGDLPAGFGSAGLRKAAQDGDARAVYELASKAADGPANQRDPKLALRLFERAAVAGLAPAQFRVGNMFEKGIGTQRDLSLARIWYQRAAERGNAKAMHNLAVLHAEGVSGKPDYAVATEWFRRAAELGVRDSQYNLAVLLGRGLGAPTDLAQSFVWFSVAARQGDEDAGRKRDEVAQRLKPDDLTSAKAVAAGWKPKTLDAVANEVGAPAKGWDPQPTAAAPKPAKQSRT
ncbi:SEL1-like repeat protein [Bosea sp. ANAM02]|uniref:SEL1-like repeat protein n=1 Tax=Bosea sp. ANAM02 TaxID=2020412 RepID=UPI00140EC826|nr:SEL1-like repeat protein [Bosea sp. ANAM02]BCB20900.1 peptidoglycan-binding protein [Bosea sp. ANAM02]